MSRPFRERSFLLDPHERPVVTDDNKVAVRGGSTGNNVRYILIASTALVIVAFIAIALFFKWRHVRIIVHTVNAFDFRFWQFDGFRAGVTMMVKFWTGKLALSADYGCRVYPQGRSPKGIASQIEGSADWHQPLMWLSDCNNRRIALERQC
jgi:hypothetical protein